MNLKVVSKKKSAPAETSKSVDVELSTQEAAILRDALVSIAKHKAAKAFSDMIGDRELVSFPDKGVTRYGLRSKGADASSTVELLYSEHDDVDPNHTYPLHGYRLSGKSILIASDALTVMSQREFVTKGKFDESKHKRDRGRFARTSGSGSSKDKEKDKDKDGEKPTGSPKDQMRRQHVAFRQSTRNATHTLASISDSLKVFAAADPGDGATPNRNRMVAAQIVDRVADILDKQDGDEWDIARPKGNDDYAALIAKAQGMVEQLGSMLEGASSYDIHTNGDRPEQDVADMQELADDLYSLDGDLMTDSWDLPTPEETDGDEEEEEDYDSDEESDEEDDEESDEDEDEDADDSEYEIEDTKANVASTLDDAFGDEDSQMQTLAKELTAQNCLDALKNSKADVGENLSSRSPQSALVRAVTEHITNGGNPDDIIHQFFHEATNDLELELDPDEFNDAPSHIQDAVDDAAIEWVADKITEIIKGGTGPSKRGKSGHKGMQYLAKSSGNEQSRLAYRVQSLLSRLSEDLADVDVNSSEFKAAETSIRSLYGRMYPGREPYTYTSGPEIGAEPVASENNKTEPNLFDYLSSMRDQFYPTCSLANRGKLSENAIKLLNEVKSDLVKLCGTCCKSTAKGKTKKQTTK